jgi:16S rRNA processing protein RimM
MKVSVAYIKRPRGLRGELAVIPYKENTQSLRMGLEITLQKGEVARNYVIETVKFLKGRAGLKLVGIEDEEGALYWCGGEVLTEKENLAALAKDEYYHFDIEGCQVFEKSGDFLGKVSAIEYRSANDVLTVESDIGQILIPFIKSVVESVDIKEKKIVIRKIEGLY